MPLDNLYKKVIAISDVLNPKLKKALDDLSAEEHVPVENMKILGGLMFHDLDADGRADVIVKLPNGKKFFYKAEEDTMYPEGN